MRHIPIVIIFIFWALAAKAQQKFALSIHGGYDINKNHLIDLQKLNTNESPDFGAGFNAIFYVREKLRIRAELEYSNISFTRDYQTDPSQPNNIAKTNVAINNIGVNPHLDYKLISWSGFELYAGGGFRFEFKQTAWQRTFNHAGNKLNGNYFRDILNPGQVGLVGSLIGRYSLGDHAAIFLAPEYTYFLRPLFGLNDHLFQRTSFKLGYEWRF